MPSPNTDPNKKNSGDDDHHRSGLHIFGIPCAEDARSVPQTRSGRCASGPPTGALVVVDRRQGNPQQRRDFFLNVDDQFGAGAASAPPPLSPNTPCTKPPHLPP